VQDVFPGGLLHIDGDVIGQIEERRSRIVDREVSKRDSAPPLLERAAGRFDKPVGRDAAPDLSHNFWCRKKRKVVLEQSLARAVNESQPVIAENIQAK
jgi:hypothetical protein